MTVFLNGQFLPEERALVSVFDRSFRYGDGLFEAVLISNGKLFRWPEHFARLRQSANFFKIPLLTTCDSLRDAMLELVSRDGMNEGIARIALSRGIGPRGYAPTGTERPTLVITTHPAALDSDVPSKLIFSSLRVAAGDVLARHKTASRLLNVLAAWEAKEHDADEALLVDTDGHVTEGTSSNVFWMEGDHVFTPPMAASLLPGITRALVFELCKKLSLKITEQAAPPGTLMKANAVFLSLTSRGIVPVCSINERQISGPSHVAKLVLAYRETVRNECG